MTRYRDRAGFTLVELLVVMLLTVLLAGSLAALLRIIVAAHDVASHRIEGSQEAMVALRTITRAMRNAYRPVTDDDVLFEGALVRRDPYPVCRVQFRAVDRRIIRSGQPESDVHDIEFFLRDESGRTLLMRRTDPTRNPPPDGGGVVEPLAQDIVGMDIQYFDGTQWVDRWPESLKSWPTAVNVRLIYRADTATGRVGTVSRLVDFPYWAQHTGGGEGGEGR